MEHTSFEWKFDWKYVDRLLKLALDEDIGSGDITTESTIPPDLQGRGLILAKSSGVLAGLPVVERLIMLAHAELSLEAWHRDGDFVHKGTTVACLKGPMSAVLTIERTALNFLQRLSGIATLTSHFVRAVEGTGARIVDTRKTTPGWRFLEKYAVRVGGGHNHRFGLYDAVLIKDNHIAAAGGIIPAVRAARAKLPGSIRIEVEVEDEQQLREALEAQADIIMLDNMSPERMRQAVRLIAGRAIVEASGGIRLDTVAEVASTGVDLISVGALTHSALPLDLSLEVETV